MAITRPRDNISTTAGSATPACSFATLPAAGSTILLIVASWKSSTHTHNSVADNQGNSYTQVGTTMGVSSGASYVRLSMWRAENIGTPSGTFTITLTASTTVDARCVIAEYAGVETAAVLDKNANATGSTNAPTATMAATTVADAVIVGATTYEGGQVTITPDATNLPTAVREDEDNNSNQCISVSQRIVASTGTYTGNWVLGGSRTWGAIVVALKGGGAAPAALQPRPTIKTQAIRAASLR